MSNITNNFAEGSVVMQAGSTLNGDVNINAPIYQFGNKKKEKATPTTEESAANIDAEGLKVYFNARFLGIAGDPGFYDSFVESLRQLKTPRRAAIVAKMIFDSKVMSNKRPKTFAEWNRTFCQLIGFNTSTRYRPSQLQPDEQLERLFYML